MRIQKMLLTTSICHCGERKLNQIQTGKINKKNTATVQYRKNDKQQKHHFLTIA